MFRNLERIDVYDIEETVYGDGSVWINYIVSGCHYGNELCYKIKIDMNNFQIEDMYQIDNICNTNKKVNEHLVNKLKVIECSKFLCDLLNKLRLSEKEIMYVEKKYIEKIFKGDEEKRHRFIEELKKEVKELGIEKYIYFDYMGYEIVVYEQVITKFLF